MAVGSWQLAVGIILCLFQPISPSSAQTTIPDPPLPVEFEQNRFMLGTAYAVKDFYYDIPALVITPDTSDGSTTTFPFGNLTHQNTHMAMGTLGCKLFYTHIKNHAYSRTPWCTTGNPHFKYSLLNQGICQDDILGSPFLQNIAPLVLPGQYRGFYVKAFEDYFFQHNHFTGTSIASPNLPDFQSPCLSTFDDAHIETISDDGGVSTYSGSNDRSSSPPPTNINPLALKFHICPNCNTWREFWFNNLQSMSSQGARFMFFDESHTPKSGCECDNCIFGSYPTYHAETNPGYQLGLYLGYQQIPDSPSITYKRRLADFMSWTNVDFMNGLSNPHRLNDAMHQHGALGIVSVQAFSSLSADDFHRSDFVRTVDIPKSEYANLLKVAQNRVFWGAEAEALLSNYRIPEYLKVATGMATTRDASKHRIALFWQNYFWPDNGPTDNSVMNNRKLRTFLGLNYSMGTIGSTTIEKIFKYDSNTITFPGSDNFYKRVWDLGPFQTTVQNPNTSEKISIFELDSKACAPFKGQKPYDYVAVYFQEADRNTSLYETGTGNWERVANAWRRTLFPMHFGMQAMFNCPELNQDPITNPSGITCYKFPVTIVTDEQIRTLDTRGLKALLVSIPEYADAIDDNQYPSLSLHNELMNFAQTGNINLIEVNMHDNYYQTGFESVHDNALVALKDKVIQEVGLPDFYVTGHSEDAKKVIAGFFRNDTNNEFVITLAPDPIWGLPREEDYDEVTIAEVPLTIPAGRIKLHLNASKFHPIAPLFCPVDVNFYNGDGVTGSALIETSTLPDSNDEYVVEVPEFTHFMRIHVTITFPDGLCSGLQSSPSSN